jgi:hypothetical protein
VDVDEAGANYLAGRIDGFACGLVDPSDRYDSTVANAEVTRASIGAASVYEGSALNQHIEHLLVLPCHTARTSRCRPWGSTTLNFLATGNHASVMRRGQKRATLPKLGSGRRESSALLWMPFVLGTESVLAARWPFIFNSKGRDSTERY